MNNLYKIQKAIKFAIKTHEVYQKQKRKGKDIPYIVHPLAAGIILAHAGADADIVCAGILHDTIEDSIKKKKVTVEMLKKRFGENVASLVLNVTETEKDLTWEERKKIAKDHIREFSLDALLVKSADILSNGLELIEDHKKDGDQIFERFNSSKEQMLKNQLEIIALIIENWSENPLKRDLQHLAEQLRAMGFKEFLPKYSAGKISFKEYDKNQIVTCPVCN